jgi:hypothetical protein
MKAGQQAMLKAKAGVVAIKIRRGHGIRYGRFPRGRRRRQLDDCRRNDEGRRVRVWCRRPAPPAECVGNPLKC